MMTNNEPICFTFDVSPSDGSIGVLACYIVGEEAKKWGLVDGTYRKEQTIRQLAQIFGDAANKVIDYHETIWDEKTFPFIGGAYLSCHQPTQSLSLDFRFASNAWILRPSLFCLY
jgi:monoamine oxidase